MNFNNKSLLYANYNQDQTHICVGTTEGFRIYSLQPKLTLKSVGKIAGGVGIIEMLFSTSLLALVGHDPDSSTFSPRHLRLYHSQKQETLVELSFMTPILSVRLNQKRLIVVRESKIHVYDVQSMKPINSFDTVSNPLGVVALSPDFKPNRQVQRANSSSSLIQPSPNSNNASSCLLLYPNSTEKGDIVVFDCMSMQPLKIIHAHNGPITKLQTNAEGTLVASCSSKGTVIRVHSLPDASRSFEFRRGLQPATIHSVAFSDDSQFLALTSDSGTVHVFNVSKSAQQQQTQQQTQQQQQQQQQQASTEQQGYSAYFQQLSSYSSYVMNDLWESLPNRGIASTKLPSSTQATTTTTTTTSTSNSNSSSPNSSSNNNNNALPSNSNSTTSSSSSTASVDSSSNSNGQSYVANGLGIMAGMVGGFLSTGATKLGLQNPTTSSSVSSNGNNNQNILECISGFNELNQVMILSSEGMFYQYGFVGSVGNVQAAMPSGETMQMLSEKNLFGVLNN